MLSMLDRNPPCILISTWESGRIARVSTARRIQVTVNSGVCIDGAGNCFLYGDAEREPARLVGEEVAVSPSRG